MSTETAILTMRRDPKFSDLIRDSYLGENLREAAEQFLLSVEFGQIRRFLGKRLQGATVLDLGAGNGIASYAFARAGANKVYAVEPDPSEVLGAGAIRQLAAGLPIEVLQGEGARIALPDQTVDIFFARQVLHHIHDLPSAMREFRRVLKPGGRFIACRDHVVDDAKQLEAFLANHPVHQMVGGEHAHSLPAYVGAFRGAGFILDHILGPLDSIINAFPHFRTEEELTRYPARILHQRFGPLGKILSMVPGVKPLVRRRLTKPVPGRLYSFVAHKP